MCPMGQGGEVGGLAAPHRWKQVAVILAPVIHNQFCEEAGVSGQNLVIRISLLQASYPKLVH